VTKPRIRALVLAAGEGTRLRPLTSFLPKPLLPVAGRPLIEHTLDRLAKVGCEAVAINLHHLGDAIRDHLGDDHQGMPITWSEERDERLGTLGALHPLRDFLRPAEVILLVNGDSLCAWPFSRLLRRHRDGGAAATLLTGFIVLIGAAAAGERRRVYEAAILKTVGATRGRILASFALRSAMLGAAAGAVAILGGGLAGWGVMTFVMDSDYAFEPASALAIVTGGALATLLAGLAFAWRPLAARPAQVLRARE